MDSEIEKLKKRAQILGIDVDVLVKEIGVAVASNLPLKEIATAVAALLPPAPSASNVRA